MSVTGKTSRRDKRREEWEIGMDIIEEYYMYENILWSATNI